MYEEIKSYGINLEEFNQLYNEVGWGAYDNQITKRALENTFYSISVYDNDEIVGYITRGRGVTVHRTDCENVLRDKEKNASRMIKVSWIEDINSKFEAELQIKANDRRGIINEVTHVISNEKVGLVGIYARKGTDIGVTIDLSVEVVGMEELNSLIRKMKNIPGVEEAYRVHGR